MEELEFILAIIGGLWVIGTLIKTIKISSLMLDK